MAGRIVGLTGGRGVGKTTVADVMVREHGFTKIHAFGPGKAMCVAYFTHLGMDPDTAYRCVHGDLKDTKHDLIPGDGLPRTFMEQLGRFMGVELGPEYTVGAEIDRALRADPGADLVIESVVYEADFVQFEKRTKVVRVIRPQANGVIEGMHTDAAVEKVKPDAYLFNNLDNATALSVQVETTLAQLEHTPFRTKPIKPGCDCVDCNSYDEEEHD